MKPFLTLASAFMLVGTLGVAQAQQTTGEETIQQRQQARQTQQGQRMIQRGQRMMEHGHWMVEHGQWLVQRGQRMMQHQRQRSQRSGFTRHRRVVEGMRIDDMRHRMAHRGMTQIMFAIMDADGDQALSLEEIHEGASRVFNHVDENDDGKLTMEEFSAFHRDGPVRDANRNTEDRDDSAVSADD